jgi:predicted nucleic acid-binding protein
MTIDKFLLILDTNLLYTHRPDYNIFHSSKMKKIVQIKTNYNQIFGEYKQIDLYFPQMVIEET